MSKGIIRYILLGLCLIIILQALTQPALAETTVLKKGMSGKAVESLQDNLRSLGFFNHECTGYFGDITQEAVIFFQKYNCLSADGIAGKETLSLISKFIEENTVMVLKKGMSGEKVLNLQKDLRTLRLFNQEPTGYFGSVTHESVVKFQKNHNLTPDGYVQPATYIKLQRVIKETVKKTKIVIDPGHGGVDPGTQKNGVVEKEVNLDISKKLQALMNSGNYDTVLTRKNDVSLDSLSNNGDTRERRDLSARVNIISENKPELFVSIHVNSNPWNPDLSGSIVYYNDKIPKSKALAVSIQNALNNIPGYAGIRAKNSIRTENFYILRNSSIPGILVETAFITNKQENKLLKQKDFREKISKAIMEGIDEHVASNN